jgi:4-amino-4-deoxy-L-arabinose transferase-like glycosyltransferase
MTAGAEEPQADENVEPDPGQVKRPLALAAIGIALVGAFFYAYSGSNLWLDEALSVNVARLPLADLHNALKHDGAPPLYYLILHFWSGAFGTGATAVRLLSALCMASAVVTLWFVARRWLGETVAWLTALLMVVNPYAYRYATETRMYALLVLLVSLGILAVQRALERPTVARVALFGIIVALAVYTQYWAFYLLPVCAAVFIWMMRTPGHRIAARRLLVAMGVGLLAFLPWVPTFLYQNAHTGTPWGRAMLPTLPIAFTIRDFAGGVQIGGTDLPEAWMLLLIVFTMLLLGIFGSAADQRRIEVDIRTQREARLIAFVGGAGLAVATSLAYVSGSAFQTRYSAIVFPFFVLLVARGLSLFRDRRVLAGIITAIVVFGFLGGARNVNTQRTQAGPVASVLRNDARPGDVVVYCPDQLGPGVTRLVPKGLQQFTYPAFGNPKFVDWVDYVTRLQNADPSAFANEALRRASGHTLWYVYSPLYITHPKSCLRLAAAFARTRTAKQRIVSARRGLERPLLEEFPASTGGG